MSKPDADSQPIDAHVAEEMILLLSRLVVA